MPGPTPLIQSRGQTYPWFGKQSQPNSLTMTNGATTTYTDSSGRAIQTLPTSYWQYQKLTAATGTVSFTSIPVTGTNLRIVWKARGTDAGAAVDFRGQINGNTGVVYSVENMTVDGATVTSANSSGTSFKVGSLVAAGSSANGNSGGVIEIPGYADTVLGGVPIMTRCVYSQVAGTTAKMEFDTNIYVQAAPTPVTRIDLFPSANLIAVGSVFTLYIE